jgi:hypothetical protein
MALCTSSQGTAVAVINADPLGKTCRANTYSPNTMQQPTYDSIMPFALLLSPYCFFITKLNVL